METDKPASDNGGAGADAPLVDPVTGAPAKAYVAPRNAVDRLSRNVGNWISWLFLVAAAISCYEVIADAFFDAPTVWVHDTTIMLCATAFLFGGAYALQRQEHIRITVLYDLFGGRTRWSADMVTLVLSAVYLAALATFTGFQAFESISIVERSGRAWDFPMPMVIRTSLFLGAALLLAQTLSEIVKHWQQRGRPASPST